MHRRLGLASLLGLACLALLASSGAIAGKKSTNAITPSPTYTAAQLGAPAGDDWLVHFGNLKGHRYSSLTQINKQNVGTLKQVWHVDLGVCPSKGTACGSMESNAVVANGVQYTQTAPLGDVFAIDGVTGQVIWKWTPTYDAGFNVGTGGRRAGVAIGEGKVFAGLADGRLYALDQVTGKVS